MRAGILVLGPLLAKFGSAKVSLPGGCNWYPPHRYTFKSIIKTCKIQIKQGYVHATAPKGLKEIKFFPRNFCRSN